MSWITKCNLNWLQLLTLRIIKTGNVPRHVAFIMDGNRRYANKQNVAKKEVYSKGYASLKRKFANTLVCICVIYFICDRFKKLFEMLGWCVYLGIKEVTVYAFSIDNFKRSKEEVDELMNLNRQKLNSLLQNMDSLMVAGVCIRVIGNLSLIPEDINRLIAQIMIKTKDNNKGFLNLAISYTSRDELTHAIKDIATGVKNTEILPEDITEDLISDCLYLSSSPDLLIRTSGEVRLSDFLMWQLSNACLYFTDTLWPDISIWNLLGAVFYYQKCYSDLQKLKNNSKTIAPNSRTSKYIAKFYCEREITIENMYQSTA
ncbi:dehydrodolichyl diphosphate synthase complex subunit DHDDS-like isoform X1 [Solenopsis invicta]|uniref:dehydrodolichyl diphosphate synthase complex subunit DHDDS-like isoform X1 n=1 Tax=Solenopsis invicta TaxID=13686 RepID=UPI00193E1320|nr:dehydrodolichyl diphosphate synthase complex subunit DHDDS-like isoform X1 [Solenopsis invicta]